MATSLRNLFLLPIVILSLSLLGVSVPVEAADSTRQLSGTFRWTQGSDRDQPLQVTLTPLRENLWQATFTFRFNGSRNRWRGELQGSLDHGEVTGTVSQGRGRRPRTWRIAGTVRDGVLQARHYEQHGRRGETLTGTIRLRVAD